jgi:hypothetical protein
LINQLRAFSPRPCRVPPDLPTNWAYSEKGEPVYIGIGTVLLIILIILLIAFVF